MSSRFVGSVSRAVVLAGAVALVGKSSVASLHGQESEDRGALAAVLKTNADGAAQRSDDQDYRGFWDDPQGEIYIYGHVALPVGEFQTHVELGGGGGIGAALFLDRDHWVALRVDAGGIVYGSESYDAPLSTTIPVDVRVSTVNSILSAGIGPQVYLSRGAVRPYVFGTFGLSYFVTETNVRGHGAEEPFASTINFDDLNMALNGGGGVSIEVYKGEMSVAVDVSASYQRNGIAEYLVKGDLGRGRWDRWYRDTGGRRGVPHDPIISDANLVAYRVGISLGVG